MNTSPDEIDYSIVICTYNPDERILKRCLAAVGQLDLTGLQIEVIIVDNNSNLPVNELDYVKRSISQLPNARCLLVKEQGVNHARMAAINISSGNSIVYFDSDNEPDSAYLQQLKTLQATYPQVGAWGPGNVEVDFIDGVDPRIAAYARTAFQQRKDTATSFDHKPEWQQCYPFGTGLCTFTFLLKEYNRLAAAGVFTLSGRKGQQLSSGEDTQMVLLCISRGYYAGVAPGLKLHHLIPGTRANAHYLQRLAYGTNLCYQSCLLQVFPGKKEAMEKERMPAIKLTRQILKKLLKAKWNNRPQSQFELASFIGSQLGVYAALDIPPPLLVKRMIRYLRLD